MRNAFVHLFAAMLLVATPSARALAQVPGDSLAGVVLGSVISDSTGKPVAGAIVRLPQLSRGTRTNWTGDFAFDQLPAGHFDLVVEAPGFAPATFALDVPAKGSITQYVKLRPTATSASEGDVVMSAVVAPVSARAAAYERRKSEGHGNFLSSDELRRRPGQKLADVLRPVILGSTFQLTPSGGLRLVSTRDAGQNALDPERHAPCLVEVFVDGISVSVPASTGGTITLQPNARSLLPSINTNGEEPGYDFSPLVTDDYEAVEYYADPSTTPPEFRRSGGKCGAIVLWTRRSGH